MKYTAVIFLSLMVSVSIIFPFQVSAAGGTGQDCNPPVPGYYSTDGGRTCILKNPAPNQLVDFSDAGSLIQRFIETMLYFAGAVATFFLIIGGYRYVTSAGNEEAMEKAKKNITSAVIGIVIIVMAYAIVLLVNNFLTKTARENVSVIFPGFVL